MNNSFESLPWHDGKLLGLSVDRRDPGHRDEVKIRVVWPQGDEATLVFRDCYAITAEMNFGVIAEETIASAALSDDDPRLASIRDSWKHLGVPLDMLRCYMLQTASTSSIIRIYALAFEVT